MSNDTQPQKPSSPAGKGPPPSTGGASSRGEEPPRGPRKQNGEGEGEVRLDSLGQLREILFGQAQRELERRIARADAHLVSRAHDLEEESRRRLDTLEQHLVKETEALTTRLERELVERGDLLRAITREQRESQTSLDQRLKKIEEAVIHAQRELRQDLLAQAKRFMDELHRLRQEFAQTIERELGLAEGDLEDLGHGDEKRPSP